jgi:hypothetical protein
LEDGRPLTTPPGTDAVNGMVANRLENKEFLILKCELSLPFETVYACCPYSKEQALKPDNKVPVRRRKC